MEAEDPVSSRFRCQTCQRTFTRAEHLTRHVRSHQRERSLKCSTCNKGFYRVDALTRHERTHEFQRRTLPGTGSRACLPCANGRRRCSGEIVCSGCRQRHIECVYSNHVSSLAPASHEISPLSADEVVDAEVDKGPSEEAVWVEPPRPLFLPPRTIESGEVNMDRDSENEADGAVYLHMDISQPERSELRRDVRESQEEYQPSQVLESFQEIDERFGAWGHNAASINWLYDHFLPNYTHTPEIDPNISSHVNSHESPLGTQQIHSGPGSVKSLPSSLSRNEHGTADTFVETPQQSADIAPQNDLSMQGEKVHSGRYYVDGDGARLPHVAKLRTREKRRTGPFQSPVSRTSENMSEAFWFPETPFQSSDEEEKSLIVDDLTYEKIKQYFRAVCLMSTHFSTFTSNNFPTLIMMNTFVRRYFDSFHQTMPFMHQPTFQSSPTNWILVLALASIGSHYVELPGVEDHEYSVALHEFLRRVIETVTETCDGEDEDQHLLLTQAKLLNCVGMMYCGNQKFLKSIERYHGDLVKFFDTCCKIVAVRSGVDMEEAGCFSVTWESWCAKESIGRTGYCIWMIDCMRKFHSQLRSILTLEEARAPLPCQEVLWEAESASRWQQIYNVSIPCPSLRDALQLVYIGKRLQPSMGEFSRILLIHALYKRTWDVEDYVKQPLSTWSPAADKKPEDVVSYPDVEWLPGNTTFAKWRNSACDCLDILHWHANSVIGAVSGMEHPTVLHLHLARVVLLSPYESIIKLTKLMVSGEDIRKAPEVAGLNRFIRRWANEDQYKARLAMIHAGVTFWHIRRFSIDGFYEASSLFLATLALWAFSISEIDNLNGSVHEKEPSRSDSDEELHTPMSILLDRPTDDELVQCYVKNGGKMRAEILGVGDIRGPKAPLRILREGKKLLLDSRSWGISQKYVNILIRMEVLQVGP